MQGEASSSRASALARDTFIFGEPRPLATVKEAIQNVTLESVNSFLAARPNVGYTVMTYGPTLTDSTQADNTLADNADADVSTSANAQSA
jgi:predicted Zn-dependent peptidase